MGKPMRAAMQPPPHPSHQPTAHAAAQPRPRSAVHNAVQSSRARLAKADWQRGLAHASAQHWPEAARAFGRAARAVPQDRLYGINLAHAQRHAGALPRAVAAARRCLQLDAADPLALRLLAWRPRHISPVMRHCCPWCARALLPR